MFVTLGVIGMFAALGVKGYFWYRQLDKDLRAKPWMRTNTR